MNDTVILSNQFEQKKIGQRAPLPLTLVICTFIFVACMLCTVAPLHRVAGTPLLLHLLTSKFLEIWAVWLPSNLHLTKDPQASHISSNYIEFLLLVAVAFIAYSLAALIISRQRSKNNYLSILRLIWAGTIITSLIFVLTPAMLSRDIFVYAGFGRVISVYHANPYFVPLNAFPHDPFIPLDDWRGSTSAYGPLWLAISALVARILREDPLQTILAYRVFGLAAHLLNTWLIYTMLCMIKRSPREVLIGTLLYAWNPLVLLESCLGAHNDIFVVTLILLGICLCIRAEHRGFTLLRSFLPVIVVFTVATMVKFTAAPLIVFSLVLLARHCLPLTESNKSLALSRQWALMKILSAGCISLIIALAMYAPFWVGHDIHDVTTSFTSPPSASSSFGSILSALQFSIRPDGLPTQKSWFSVLLYQLSQHSVWNVINLAVLISFSCFGCVCLWRTPSARTLALITLGTFCALLVVTPWFFPWYVTWLVGLVPVCLPVDGEHRVGRSAVAFALTFSFSAFLFYLLTLSPPPIGGWVGLRCLSTIGPPILAFCIFIVKHNIKRRPGVT
jgi:hypothetical protein